MGPSMGSNIHLGKDNPMLQMGDLAMYAFTSGNPFVQACVRLDAPYAKTRRMYWLRPASCDSDSKDGAWARNDVIKIVPRDQPAKIILLVFRPSDFTSSKRKS